ncbi:MAG: hypothetical protein JWP04_3991, partial [Belnapia sp.]|nr:hypothetical protein [Belnapia sp.]
ATLVVLGQGPLAARLAAHPAAGGPLRLAGQVADVADWLLAADTLVLPSQLEGWPLIFLEAAANRCPVVATAAALECLGEAAEQVASLVPLPTIAALALHISATFTHDAAVRQRIDAAEALSRRQGLDTMLRRYCAMLRACHRGAAT